MHILREPDAEAAFTFLKSEILALNGKGTRSGRLVQVLGGCTVDYQGRAASTLDQGERLVMLKPDGTLLVHTSTKAKPVNWMPPGHTEFAVEMPEPGDLDDSTTGNGAATGVILTALRRKPHNELVRIAFHDVQLLQALPLRDSEELVLKRTEGDLHKLFFERPDLIEEGLVFHRGEKRTARGPVDLWGTDADGNRVLVEVKRSKGGIAEATQLWRYVEMERTGRYADGNADRDTDGTADEGAASSSKIRGILVAVGVSDKARKMLDDHDLEYTPIDWDDLLAHLERPRSAGQRTLGFFGGGQSNGASKRQVVERTVRTGKKR